MSRRVDFRRLKELRTYTLEELAHLLGCHKNTVRGWLRAGLNSIDQGRPLLIHGGEAKAFLAKRRQGQRRTCRTHELYCFKCRAPREPAGSMLDYEPRTASSGTARALCESCLTQMFKSVSCASLGALRSLFDVHVVGEHEHLTGCAAPPSICHLSEAA